jgi:hypothetical protein
VIVSPGHCPISPHQLRRTVGTLLPRNDAQLTADTCPRAPWACHDCCRCTGGCSRVFDQVRVCDAHRPRGGVWILPLWAWCTPRRGSGCQRWGWVSPAAGQRGHKTRRLRPATRGNHDAWRITAGAAGLCKTPIYPIGVRWGVWSRLCGTLEGLIARRLPLWPEGNSRVH